MFKFLKNKSYNESDFINALLNNIFNLEDIENAYNENIDLNKKDDKGVTLLHKCALKAYVESAKWLLDKNVDIEAQDINGETALFYAMNSNNSEIVKFLLENGANINHKNKDLRLAVQEAVINGKRTSTILLNNTKDLNNKDKYGNNLIFDALANGNVDLIEKIAKHEKIDINCINKNKETILNKKSVLDNVELASLLLQNGANPTILDSNGKNFLFNSLSKGIESFQIINLAVSLGFDINCRDRDNNTLLMEVINNYINSISLDPQMKESHFELIKRLIDFGIDINAVDDNDETLFFRVIRSNDLDLMNYFLTFENINVNQKNRYGETLLMYACYAGFKNKALIDALINLGSDVNIRDTKGETVVEKLIEIVLYYHNKKLIDIKLIEKINRDGDYFNLLKYLLKNTKVDMLKYNSNGHPLFFDSIIYYNFDLFKMLKHYGVNINQKDVNHHNIIFYLMKNAEDVPSYVQKKYLTTLQSLINIGVDINAKDDTGATALHRAILEKDMNTVRILLDSKPDYEAVDDNGRNIVHNVVWKNCPKTFKLVNSYNQDIVNQADNFGVLPINYAAFMGEYDLVITMLDEAAHVNNTNKINKKMIEFFSKFHDNVKKLTNYATNSIDEQSLKLLTDNMIKKFEIEEDTSTS